MSKCGYAIFGLALAISSAATALEPPDKTVLQQQLLLLDRISYHPSLLPLIMENIDYLELTQAQQQRLRDWRASNAPAMLEKMKEVAKGRVEFIDLSLNPESSGDELVDQQKRLFMLQEEVLSYKLSCRQNILETFTPEQWEALQLIMAEY